MNKQERKAYNLAYYLKNGEKIRKHVRDRWRNDPQAKAKDKACREKRRDKIRAYDRMRAKRDSEKRKVIIARWIKNNTERFRAMRVAISQRRRARLADVGGTWSLEDVERSLVSQKNKCWWCSKKLPKKFHVDHRFPIAKGGTNNPDNIVISCPPCNFAKNSKMPWEFAGRLL